MIICFDNIAAPRPELGRGDRMVHAVLIGGKITTIKCGWLDLEGELKRRSVSMVAWAFSSETSDQFEIDKRIYQKQHGIEWIL